MSQQKRLPLFSDVTTRDTSLDKDARLINGFVERKKGQEESVFHVFKRPCLLANVTVAAGTAGMGVYNWLNDIYSIFGGNLYKNSVLVGAVDSTNGVYTFSQCLGATPKLFFHNGVEAYTYDSGAGLVNVTDVDFPAASCKGSAYLDGTTYIVTTAAAVQGSGINDPQSWDALNVLIAQIEPDAGVFLAKQLVYIIVFKGWSTEVFYDKANAVGSPLGTVQGGKVNYGCRTQGSVQDVNSTLFWVSQTRDGAVGVMKLEGLKGQSIATPAIERVLQDATYTTTHSWSMHISGHKFYGLTLVESNITLVYDIGENVWYQWTDTSGNYWPIVDTTFDSSQRVIAQHATNGKLYYVDTDTYQDDSALISWELYTPNWDAETKVSKYVNRLAIIGDKTSSSTLDCRVSDDDYQTWSAYRTFDLSQKLPFLQDWASFTRRAHHFRHRANTALRLQAAEMTLELGTL